MKMSSYTKYYRVFKHDTSVTVISTNNFKQVKIRRSIRRSFSGHPVDVLCEIPQNQYSLLPDAEMFYGYLELGHAMDKAKEGAQKYIGQMVKNIEQDIKKLKDYREHHYEGLNIHLLDGNIRRLEKEMNIK